MVEVPSSVFWAEFFSVGLLGIPIVASDKWLKKEQRGNTPSPFRNTDMEMIGYGSVACICLVLVIVGHYPTIYYAPWLLLPLMILGGLYRAARSRGATVRMARLARRTTRWVVRRAVVIIGALIAALLIFGPGIDRPADFQVSVQGAGDLAGYSRSARSLYALLLALFGSAYSVALLLLSMTFAGIIYSRLVPGWGRQLRVVLLVTRAALMTLRIGLVAIHSTMMGARSLSLSWANKAIATAGKPALFALIAYALAVWVADYRANIVTELEIILRSIPVIYRQAILHGTLDGIQGYLILPAPHATNTDDAPGAIWLFVNAFRLLTLAAMLMLLLAMMLLAVSVVAAILAWFAGLIASMTPGTLTSRSAGARFANILDVLWRRNRRGTVFGHYAGAPLRLHTDKHVLIMASTRSGKGISLIIPHLLRYRGSAFVLDPKGENARATGRRRAELNGQVHYLDPFGISGKRQSRFNPLSRFTPENMEGESKALAAALFASVQRDHWSGSAQQLLASFILHVFTSPEYPPEKKDLNTVRRLLLGGVLETLDRMLHNDAADGLLMSLATSFQGTPPGEFGSIVSNAQRETEILDNPFIAKCIAASGDGNEVDFSAWHRGTMSVFLCLSAPKFPVFNRWLRLVLTSALDEMTDRLNPPSLPVCFMLDELATLGHLETVENAIGLAAGYGVQLFTVFQDVAQMRDLYQGRWASFIGNAGVRAIFSLDDYDTARYWSDFIGARTIKTRSENFDAFRILRGASSGETAQPLLTPDQFMLRYAADRMLILPQGSHPIEVERVPYFRDIRLDGLWDDPRGPLPGTVPAPAPAAPPTGAVPRPA